jgi:sortase B
MDREQEAPRRRSHRRKRNSSRLLYYIVLIVLLAVLVFSAGKIISYLSQQKASENEQQNLIDDFVTPGNTDSQQQEGQTGEDTQGEGDNTASEGENQSTTEKTPEPVYVPEPDTISVDLAGLKAKYPDVKGYIYAANTGISYAIVKGSDNSFYLDHGIDGSKNNNGAIFIETLCDENFGSQNTIIYGHHMKSGRMFAPLEKYKSQSYYDAHPYMYIYTESQNYRIDLFAGCVVEGDADIYATSVSADILANYVAKSTFKSKIGTPTGKIVTLSTCDYTSGYSDPRYVVLGQLVPID